jgi:hypothetical protein
VEVVTHSSGGPKGGEIDADVQVHESCNIGVIELMRDLKGPREGLAICEEYLLVPRFEGEEDNRAEMMDLPVAHESFAQNESLTAENFDLSDFALKTVLDCVVELPPSVVDILVGCAKFIKPAETHHNEWDVAVFVILQFELFWAVGDCEERQKAVVSTCRGGGLILEDVGHLVRPPGYVSDKERWLLSSRICLLITHSLIVDDCRCVSHAVVASADQPFWDDILVLCQFKVECWNVESPSDKCDTKSQCVCS